MIKFIFSTLETELQKKPKEVQIQANQHILNFLEGLLENIKRVPDVPKKSDEKLSKDKV